MSYPLDGGGYRPMMTVNQTSMQRAARDLVKTRLREFEYPSRQVQPATLQRVRTSKGSIQSQHNVKHAGRTCIRVTVKADHDYNVDCGMPHIDYVATRATFSLSDSELRSRRQLGVRNCPICHIIYSRGEAVGQVNNPPKRIK